MARVCRLQVEVAGGGMVGQRDSSVWDSFRRAPTGAVAWTEAVNIHSQDFVLLMLCNIFSGNLS